MRRDQYTVSHTDVCGFAIQTFVEALAFLPGPCSVAVTAGLLVQLLVRAAAEARSLWAVCRDAVLDRKAETVRAAVRSWLPPAPEQLLPGLLAALHRRRPRGLRRRPRAMAID